jgi:hypothetical protein
MNMSIFDSAIANDERFFEGIVTAVDPERMVCNVRSSFGQGFSNVTWLMHLDAPMFNDRVLVTIMTGNPLILGKIPKISDDVSLATHIDTDSLEADAGNLSGLSGGLVGNAKKPGDIVAGDVIASNTQGGLVALLRGGTFVAKASRLAQILLSRYDDLVRIVGRNFELFTDVGSEIYANVRGRVYKFVGIGHNTTTGRSEAYRYTETYGDVALGESLRGNIYGSDPVGYPVATNIIKNVKVYDGSNGLLMKYELDYTTGRQFQQVQNSGATSYTYVDHFSTQFDVKTFNGTYTRITTTPTSVSVSYNGTNNVTITSSSILLSFNGTNTVTVSSSSIVLSANSGAHTLTVDSTGVNVT